MGSEAGRARSRRFQDAGNIRSRTFGIKSTNDDIFEEVFILNGGFALQADAILSFALIGFKKGWPRSPRIS
jgi:hypothetical protein